MWRISLIAVTLVATGFVITLLSDVQAQRRVYSGRLNIQQLVRRIEQLERRVATIERARSDRNPTKVVMSAEKAKEHVAAAKQRQAFSEKLYSKGYISEAELEADRFEFTRALKVLQFAEAARDGKPTEDITTKIAILQAEHNLAVAKRQLQFAKSMTIKGFSVTDLGAHRRVVDEAQKRLEEAKAQQ